MSAKLKTGPTIEPLTAAETLEYLGILDASRTAYADSLIVPIREWGEGQLRRALLTQTWQKYLDAFPVGAIELPMPPLQSVTSVVYVAPDGTTQQIQAGDLYVDNADEPGWIMPAYGKAWPATRAQANAVCVEYVCGWPAADQVPKAIKLWLLAHIASMDANNAAHTETRMDPIAFVDRIVDRYRIMAGVA